MASTRILLAGAGTAGRMALEEIRRHPEAALEPVGFLDDAPGLHGTDVLGLPVLGRLDALVEIAVQHQVDEVLIAIPSAHGPVIRRLIQLCGKAGLRSRIVPGMMEIIRGDVYFEQIRPVRPEDLLGREVVELVTSPIQAALHGRRILVTGAGGSIGKELCNHLVDYGPSEVFLLGRGENSVFDIHRKLQDHHPELKVTPVIADVRDEGAMQRLAARLKPQIIFHAAAHKHVPYMESFPSEAVLNNVWGTLQVIRMAQAAASERLVSISTDKAVKPRSIMGATKRFAEHLLQAQHQSQESRGGGPALMAVRFGNVLASRGSVVPLFQAQLRRGVPLTVTHPDATRFFMTVREASLLVLQASALGKGGEVFTLRMGEAVRILDLARDVIALSGFDPEKIPIRYTGLRPGEKLHEELHAAGDVELEAPHPHIHVARLGALRIADVMQATSELTELAKSGNDDALVRRLETILPDYKPEES